MRYWVRQCLGLILHTFRHGYLVHGGVGALMIVGLNWWLSTDEALLKTMVVERTLCRIVRPLHRLPLRVCTEVGRSNITGFNVVALTFPDFLYFYVVVR